jgi:hypothetical protein
LTCNSAETAILLWERTLHCRSVFRRQKRATEVAQNALRAHYIKKDLRFFPLVRVLPDKNPNPAKNTNMRLTVSTPAITTLSKNMTLLQLPCCDGIKLSKQAGENIDRDQCGRITDAGPGVKEEKLTCIN